MENTTYEAPELIELGILNVDTLAKSGEKKHAGGSGLLSEAREIKIKPDMCNDPRYQDQDVCSKDFDWDDIEETR